MEKQNSCVRLSSNSKSKRENNVRLFENAEKIWWWQKMQSGGRKVENEIRKIVAERMVAHTHYNEMKLNKLYDEWNVYNKCT